MARTTIKNQQSATCGEQSRTINNQQFAGRRNGSAIILAIVLTTLLAIIGVLFLISSRVDSIATSAIADSKDLTLAVDTVIAQISQDLVNDVSFSSISPGCYADYPDASNFWLACLEPYDSGAGYRWRQISNIYNDSSLLSQNMEAEILPDYNNTFLFGAGTPADADGDGVSDSIWVTVQDMNSNKGKPVFAAVRIIDNGGMLNVNTAFKFDPLIPAFADGNSQLDIDLMALAVRDNTHTAIGEKETRLLSYRCGSANTNFYEQNVIWQYLDPCYAPYTPFDISDELVLRYRYILNRDTCPVRIENLWTNAFNSGLHGLNMPSSDPNSWFIRANNVSIDPNFYNYNHIATTYNYDRIIEPNGAKMYNINSAVTDVNTNVRDRIERAFLASGINTAVYDPNQIAINLIDYIDDNNDVNYIEGNKGGIPWFYFGFERPCIYISEVVASFKRIDDTTVARSYAIELYNPYIDTIIPSEWQINIGGTSIDFTALNWNGNSRFFIIRNIDTSADLTINLADAIVSELQDFIFIASNEITLLRKVNGLPLGNDFITVDRVSAHPDIAEPAVGDPAQYTYSMQRDITLHKCIRRLWRSILNASDLGNVKSFDPPPDYYIQAHPANKPFTNVGEFGQLFYNTIYDYNYGGVPVSTLLPVGVVEPQLRINLADLNFQQIFKYLTVIDPCDHGPQAVNESRIKGRININTAPWFVIAQLPWISYHTPNYDLARAIVDYRNNNGPFRNVGELINVGILNSDPNNLRRMDYYDIQSGSVFPALTPPDGTSDKFELRDAIFTRISNLVTVRSDVFTAYILVRIDKNGPQKRVIAILDRSAVTPAGGKVKIIAIQNVPDPR